MTIMTVNNTTIKIAAIAQLINVLTILLIESFIFLNIIFIYEKIYFSKAITTRKNKRKPINNPKALTMAIQIT